MPLRIGFRVLILVLVASASALAPVSLRGEGAKPPEIAGPTPAEPPQKNEPGAEKSKGHVAAPSAAAEIITDLTRLPAPVARTRERLLAAARSGDLHQLAALMTDSMPIFSFTDDKDPIAFWKANYPDSDGIEVLAILTMILEAPFVHVDQGVRMSLTALTPQQKVELFRLVTGADYKDMMKLGAYAFYRLGISPDGTWQFFVTGD